jgi:hypothetical protein
MFLRHPEAVKALVTTAATNLLDAQQKNPTVGSAGVTDVVRSAIGTFQWKDGRKPSLQRKDGAKCPWSRHSAGFLKYTGIVIWALAPRVFLCHGDERAWDDEDWLSWKGRGSLDAAGATGCAARV